MGRMEWGGLISIVIRGGSSGKEERKVSFRAIGGHGCNKGRV